MILHGTDLPDVNATLNATTTVLLISALWAVKTRRYRLHRNLMLAAILTSALFLVSYLTYHFGVRLTKRYEGPLRPLYLAILLSHTVLAIGVLPLILVTLVRALRAHRHDHGMASADMHQHFARHRAIARWTYPIWLHVSITGVLVYALLYQLPNFFPPG